MAFALLAAGCLVADPPNSTDPEKTPPLLLLGQADPPVYVVTKLSTKSPTPRIPISVPVRSEDSGDRLHFDFYVDWNGADQDIIEGRYVDPSTFSDTSRSIDTEWAYGSLTNAGCKQVTLVVTHASNFVATYPTPVYTNPADFAIATWFFNVDDDPIGTNTLSGCPTPTPNEPQ
jgi:hypothetical protein